MFRPLLTSILAVAICSTASAQVLKRTASHYGTACGPTLTATIQPKGNTHQVSLTLKGAKSDSKLIVMIAANKTDLPLSLIFLKTQANCRLLLVPIFIQQKNPSSTGTFTFSHSVPSDWLGIGHAQFLEFQSDGTVLATNGATVTSTM